MSNAVEPTGSQSAQADVAKPVGGSARLRFGSFTFTRSPAGRCIVQVELEYNGQRFVGKGEGQSSPIGDLRLGAEAAMQAVESFAQNALGLELMGVKLVRAFDVHRR